MPMLGGSLKEFRMSDPRVPESKTNDHEGRTDVFDGSRDNHSTHSAFHTAADGVTTHDYERVSDDNDQTTVVVNTPDFQGNVISGGDQYDGGWDQSSFDEASTSQES